MIEITYTEAVALYPECELYIDGDPVGEEAHLRKKSIDIYGQSYNGMLMLSLLVYRKLAQRYMDT